MDGSEIQKPLFWALGIGVATFFIQFTSISTSSSNGVLTSCSYTDYFALPAGVILLLFGLSRIFRSKDDPTAMLLSFAVTALGAVHIARGLGMIMSPCG